MINPKIAGILGTDTKDIEPPTTDPIVVEPHEVIHIKNDKLPNMVDINYKLAEGEKELQTLIDAALTYQQVLAADTASIEPQYKSRYIEVLNGTMTIALNAIQTKLKTQEVKKTQRMKEASFEGRKSEGGNTNNNFFFGSREDLLIAMAEPVEDISE